jgi:hypothetical protein
MATCFDYISHLQVIIYNNLFDLDIVNNGHKMPETCSHCIHQTIQLCQIIYHELLRVHMHNGIDVIKRLLDLQLQHTFTSFSIRIYPLKVRAMFEAVTFTRPTKYIQPVENIVIVLFPCLVLFVHCHF